MIGREEMEKGEEEMGREEIEKGEERKLGREETGNG